MELKFNNAKQEISTGVNPISFDAGRMYCGVGSVVLPRTTNYNDYLTNCYRNGIVTIKTDQNEILNNCLVSKGIWDDIEFPSSYKTAGSLVIWVNIPFYSKCVIIAVINKKGETVKNSQHSAFLGKIGNLTSSFIEANGQDGSMRISSQASTQGGGIFLRVLNKDGVGVHSVYVQGDHLVETENGVKFKASNNIELFIGSSQKGTTPTTFSINNIEGTRFQDTWGNYYEFTEDGFSILDKNGNQINTTEDGITLIDLNENQIIADSNGVEIVDLNNNIIKSDLNGLGFIVGDTGTARFTQSTTVKNNASGETVPLPGEIDNVDNLVLFTPLAGLLTDIITNMSTMATNIASIGVIVAGSAGTLDPAAITVFTDLSSSIASLQENIEGIKTLCIKST